MKTTLMVAFRIALAGFIVWGVMGCAGSSGVGFTQPPESNGATYVYTIQNSSTGGPGQILEFAAGANGSVSPTAVLTLPTDTYIESVATDSQGQIYVSVYLQSGQPVIEVYASGASGTATPVRTINTSDGYAPIAMATDASGLLYTVDGNAEIAVYSSTANGTATPVRVISGSLTQMTAPAGVAVDASGNIYVSCELIVSNAYQTAIQVFSSTATGNVAPTRVITNTTGVVLGIAVDSSGNLYGGLDVTTTPYSASILEWAPGASGAATPMRTISGSATGLITVGGVRVDTAGNIYVANQIAGTSSYTYAVDKFSSTASGNVAPTASMTSTSWTNAAPSIAIK